MFFNRENIFRRVSLFHANIYKPRRQKREPHYLVLSPTFTGSLGDEAMLTVALSHFPKGHVTALVWGNDDKKKYEKEYENVEDITPFTTMPPALRKQTHALFAEVKRIIKILDSATHLILIGADVLDGKYSETRSLRRLLLAELAHVRGLSVKICSFSFSDRATEATRSAIKSMSSGIDISIRDPKSAERLVGMLNRPLEANADLAFLLKAKRPNSFDINEIEIALNARRKNGGYVIGINLNRQAFDPSFDNNPERLVQVYAELIHKINRKVNCSFLFIPHDYRGEHSDEMLLIKLKNKLMDVVDVHMVTKRLSAENAKYLASISDIVITGRMHLAIASLGSCVPPLVQDYQGKVEGLLAHFSLNENVIISSEFEDTDELADKVIHKLSYKEELMGRIESRLEHIRQLAKNNFP